MFRVLHSLFKFELQSLSPLSGYEFTTVRLQYMKQMPYQCATLLLCLTPNLTIFVYLQTCQLEMAMLGAQAIVVQELNGQWQLHMTDLWRQTKPHNLSVRMGITSSRWSSWELQELEKHPSFRLVAVFWLVPRAKVVAPNKLKDLMTLTRVIKVVGPQSMFNNFHSVVFMIILWLPLIFVLILRKSQNQIL